MLIKSLATTLVPLTCESPQLLLPWLTYQQSLTRRLETKAEGVKLEVLRQRVDYPDWWDKHVLQINEISVLHREIVMWAGATPCWYARTVIPKTTYENNPIFFDRLKNESLGALIFNEKKVERISLVYYPINNQTIEYHWLDETLHCQVIILWVRLSIFTIGRKLPFFLIEIMLPGLERYSN